MPFIVLFIKKRQLLPSSVCLSVCLSACHKRNSFPHNCQLLFLISFRYNTTVSFFKVENRLLQFRNFHYQEQFNRFSKKINAYINILYFLKKHCQYTVFRFC